MASRSRLSATTTVIPARLNQGKLAMERRRLSRLQLKPGWRMAIFPGDHSPTFRLAWRHLPITEEIQFISLARRGIATVEPLGIAPLGLV